MYVPTVTHQLYAALPPPSANHRADIHKIHCGIPKTFEVSCTVHPYIFSAKLGPSVFPTFPANQRLAPTQKDALKSLQI
ncbi:hypothetical protein FRX31_016496 [Thalictrum thalictroides]|uniref:Uncharacterized protein n=1 Tax=Thalictrum thalictroides TaxID=46969 RepID=A0A7J6W8Z0_THATH|nr:hypothetical protein FRX31_016496 [Thalictrum thalictroides]